MGDTRTSRNGYEYTRTTTGWELSHRLVAKREMGRPISDDERVRFIDGDRTNLSPENLDVYKVKEKTAARRIAELEAKRDEIDAELEELNDVQ